MRLGILSDVHGNALALDAVLADAAPLGVERWWALGDLVLFGPRPVEVLEALAALPGIAYVGGNTDRYVLTGEQPWPHATPADAVGDVDLVDRSRRMAGAIGWAQGALVHTGLLDRLALPAEQRLGLPDGSTLLGVHASPGNDDGPGIDPEVPEATLAALLGPGRADVVVGGHTHRPTNRRAGATLALNPGSVGMPFGAPRASWLLLEADERGILVHHRAVPFDADAVVADLRARHHPSADFVQAVLGG